MERIKRILSIPRLRKFIAIIFYLLLIAIILLGLDMTATLTGIAITPGNDMLTEARWGIDEAGNNIEFIVEIDIPNWGILSKGAVVQLQMTIMDIPQYEKVTMKLGEITRFEIKFNLSETLKNQLFNTGVLSYQLLVQIRPLFLGNVMESATRYVSYQGVVS